MSERDEHDEAAERLIAEWSGFPFSSDDPIERTLADRIAADRRATVAAERLESQRDADYIRGELDQERAKVARLRDELDIALANLVQEDDGGHDLCVACGEYANQHALNCDVPGIESALADIPDDWLATKLAEERERCAVIADENAKRAKAMQAALLERRDPVYGVGSADSVEWNKHQRAVGMANAVATEIRSLGGEGEK